MSSEVKEHLFTVHSRLDNNNESFDSARNDRAFQQSQAMWKPPPWTEPTLNLPLFGFLLILMVFTLRRD